MIDKSCHNTMVYNVSGKFTMNDAFYGNVERFINHSCPPNLFSQTVVFDQDDGRISHIILYAVDDIP